MDQTYLKSSHRKQEFRQVGDGIVNALVSELKANALSFQVDSQRFQDCRHSFNSWDHEKSWCPAFAFWQSTRDTHQWNFGEPFIPNHPEEHADSLWKVIRIQHHALRLVLRRLLLVPDFYQPETKNQHTALHLLLIRPGESQVPDVVRCQEDLELPLQALLDLHRCH